jgi:isoquinoline 1-oxidoreductase
MTGLLRCCMPLRKAFGWDKPKTAGHGYGIAGGFEKGGHVGTYAEVMVNR